jgi:hypothetical protein
LGVRPERRLQADSSLPGHTPAQRTELSGGREAVMSPPVSAMITSAGDRAQLNRRREGGDPLHHRGRETVDRLVQEVNVSEDLPDDECPESKRPSSASRIAGSFLPD